MLVALADFSMPDCRCILSLIVGAHACYGKAEAKGLTLMKLADANILWRPHTADVQVVDGAHLNRALDSGPDRWMWIGLTRGDFGDRADKPKVEQELMMFITFNTLTVRDRVPVEAVHKALLAVDEYRQRISPDTPGADP